MASRPILAGVSEPAAFAESRNETYQYDTTRTRTGPDYHEHWLTKSSAGQGGFSDSLNNSGGANIVQGQWPPPNASTDPDKDSVALTRVGASPGSPQQTSPEWGGPPPTRQSEEAAFALGRTSRTDAAAKRRRDHRSVRCQGKDRAQRRPNQDAGRRLAGRHGRIMSGGKRVHDPVPHSGLSPPD